MENDITWVMPTPLNVLFCNLEMFSKHILHFYMHIFLSKVTRFGTYHI